MSAGRIIVTHVPGCRFCPNRQYYSGGVYECWHQRFGSADCRKPMIPTQMDQSNEVPAWCPLDKQPDLGGEQP